MKKNGVSSARDAVSACPMTPFCQSGVGKLCEKRNANSHVNAPIAPNLLKMVSKCGESVLVSFNIQFIRIWSPATKIFWVRKFFRTFSPSFNEETSKPCTKNDNIKNACRAWRAELSRRRTVFMHFFVTYTIILSVYKFKNKCDAIRLSGRGRQLSHAIRLPGRGR